MSEIQPSNNHNVVSKSLLAGMTAVAAAAVAYGGASAAEAPATVQPASEVPASSSNPDGYMQNTETNEAFNDAGRADAITQIPSIAQNPGAEIAIPSVPAQTAETRQPSTEMPLYGLITDKDGRAIN